VILAVLLVFLAVISSNFLILFVVKHYVEKKITAFFTSPGTDTPSRFAEHFDFLAGRVASNITGSIKGTFLQAQSVEARAKNTIEKAAITDVLGQQGGVMSLLSRFPAVAKLLQKHPDWLPIAAQLMAKGEKTISGSPEGNGHNNDISVSLNEY